MPRLFYPWHKDITGYGRGFDLKRFLHVFGWNLISRIIGAILRIFVILVGLGVEIGIILLSVTAYLSWYLMPLLIPYFIILGITTVSSLP